MIGVLANPSDYAVACEFFELFKTPWELYRAGQEYDVVLCAGEFDPLIADTKLVIVFSDQELALEVRDEIPVHCHGSGARNLLYKDVLVPIYGNSATFQHIQASFLSEEGSREAAAYTRKFGNTMLVRIGYNLFAEIRLLFTNGQPIANACIPTLELHIMLLRDLILGNGISLVEIPPVPEGYRFIACLTHDVDHPLIRQHRCDHTICGFIYRAVVGSVIEVLRRRMPVRNLLKNWSAVVALPFVHLGLVKDFWSGFDRYTELEGGVGSSFFIIPFRNRPGSCGDGPAPNRRAARYGTGDIATQIERLISRGCEIGVHGIDAWRDSSRAREELEEVRRITGKQEIGTRMHWLYFDEQSPAILETAGFDYDSTVGYNAAVGYRAGTTQAYKPLGATRLLELPLHVMDTALFFPGYLDLAPDEAWKVVSRVIDNVIRFGGCITFNWHDRSIAPERLWREFYAALVHELKSRGAWFASSSQAVNWFRKRRSTAFDDLSSGAREKIQEKDDRLPGLRLQTHQPLVSPRHIAGDTANMEFTQDPVLEPIVGALPQPLR
jgi:hypothetical protein